MTDKPDLDIPSENSSLAQWETPEVRRLDALAAEQAPGGAPDGGVGS